MLEMTKRAAWQIVRASIIVLIALTATARLDAQGNTSKVSGVSFRVDDQHDAAAWAGFTEIFNKYALKFTYAANLNLLPMDLSVLQALNSSNHEMADHTSDHSTFYFTDPEIARYKNLSGVDHITLGLNRVCLTINRIDTVNSPGELTLNIRNGCAYSLTQSKISKSVVTYPVLGLYSPERQWFFRIADYQTSASSPDSIIMLVLVSPWGEPVATGVIDSVRFRLIHLHDVSMSDAGMGLLAKRTIDLCGKNGLTVPTSWVQPGGSSPYLPAAQLKRVWGKLGYASAATYPNASLKCFNEYDPSNDKQFAIENDFDLDSADLDECETTIANMVALHSVSIGLSHFSSTSQNARPGSWQAFLKKMDDLLSWCKRKNIPVKTHREWATILHDVPQNPYVNVFPRLDVDLNEDGTPDGYIPKSGVFIPNDGAPGSSGGSYSIARPGTICLVQGLGGLEKGMNVFSISTKGGLGDSIEAVFTLHSAADIVKRYVFPATSSDWKKHDTTLAILDDVSLCDVELRAVKVGNSSPKVSGMLLSKVTDPAALNVYTIKASAGIGGAVAPSGTIKVSYDISATFSIVPNAGYKTVDVLIDSVSSGPLSTVTLSDITSNHTLVASFKQVKKPLVNTSAATNVTPASAFLNGTVNPNGLLTTYVFEIGPTTNYGFALPIQSLAAESARVPIGRSLVYLSPGTTYHYRLVATNADGSTYGNDTTFATALDTYAVMSSAGPNGQIKPLNTVLVGYGGSQNFTMKPNDGYRIDSILVDDSFVGDSASYTFQSIASNHRIRATFRPVESVTAVMSLGGGLPTAFDLSKNYPNPFNPSTTIRFAVPERSSVVLKIFDVLGAEVATLFSEEAGPGFFAATWNAAVPSGTYFYRLQAGKFVETKKMILLR